MNEARRRGGGGDWREAGRDRARRKNMVHEATGIRWHAGFNVSRWLMIVIHEYRATTLLLSILLNVLVRTTGEYTLHTLLFSLFSLFFFSSLFSRPTPWRLFHPCRIGPLYTAHILRTFVFRLIVRRPFRRFAYGSIYHSTRWNRRS